MNTLMILHPYQRDGIWMFDDSTTGLLQEPFIAGIPEIIEYATAKAGIEKPQDGFTLLFAATPFPGHQSILRLASARDENAGHWYSLEGTDMQGWLCPALLRYFSQAPDAIYCAVQKKK